MKYLVLALLFSCTATGTNINLSDMDFFRTGNETGTNTQITTQQLNAIDRDLTEKEQKKVQEGFDKGVKMGKEWLKEQSKALIESGISDPHSNMIYVSFPAMLEFIKAQFIAKNPKAKGLHKDLVLVGAVAYAMFSEWTVFEGLRSKERQRILVDRGSSWTMKSKHLLGLAMDILGRDKKTGKFSFQAIDELGMVRGILYAVYLDLKAKGLITLEWVRVLKWKKIRDAYHIEMKEPDRVVYIFIFPHWVFLGVDPDWPIDKWMFNLPRFA